jgi:hypothetical protein
MRGQFAGRDFASDCLLRDVEPHGDLGDAEKPLSRLRRTTFFCRIALLRMFQVRAIKLELVTDPARAEGLPEGAECFLRRLPCG